MEEKQLVFLVDNKVCMMQSLTCHWLLTRLMFFWPSCCPFVEVLVHLITQHLLEAIYMGKPEIPVGKSNGSRHSVRESSENMGCDLR